MKAFILPTGFTASLYWTCGVVGALGFMALAVLFWHETSDTLAISKQIASSSFQNLFSISPEKLYGDLPDIQHVVFAGATFRVENTPHVDIAFSTCASD